MITKKRIKQKEEGERIQGVLQRYFCSTFAVIRETSCRVGKTVCPSEQNLVVPHFQVPSQEEGSIRIE